MIKGEKRPGTRLRENMNSNRAGAEGAPYKGLNGEALPESGTFLHFRFMKRQGDFPLKLRYTN